MIVISLKGFKMYLHHAERYRLKAMSPKHFEACLPYAMVFGVEKEWAKNFEDIYKQAPDWYEGSNFSAMTWSTIAFSNSLSSSFSPAIKSSFTSRPGSAASGSRAVSDASPANLPLNLGLSAMA